MKSTATIASRILLLACFAWSSLGFSYTAHVCSKMGRIGLFKVCTMHQPIREVTSCCSEAEEQTDATRDGMFIAGPASDGCCKTELSSLPMQDTFTPVQSGPSPCSDVSAFCAVIFPGTGLLFSPVRLTCSDSSPPGIRDLPVSLSILRI